MIQNKTFMKIAFLIAEESKAQRRKVGAIIVKDNNIIAIGYNGTPSGFDNRCEDKVIKNFNMTHAAMLNNGAIGLGGEIKDFELRTKPEVLHAESNAISKCAKSAYSSEGASIYTTCAPCLECAKLILQSGIKQVFYFDEYHNTDGIQLLQKGGIYVERIHNKEFELTDKQFNDIDISQFNEKEGVDALHPLCERLKFNFTPIDPTTGKQFKLEKEDFSTEYEKGNKPFEEQCKEHVVDAFKMRYAAFPIEDSIIDKLIEKFNDPFKDIKEITLLTLVNLYNFNMMIPGKDINQLELLRKYILKYKSENEIDFPFPLLLVKNVKFIK